MLRIEQFIAPDGIVKREVVTDDDLWFQPAVADVLEQFGHDMLDMGLTHAELQALLERIAKQEGMNEARMDARHADDAAFRVAALAWRKACPLLPSSFMVVNTVSSVLPFAWNPTASMLASTPRR